MNGKGSEIFGGIEMSKKNVRRIEGLINGL